MTKRKFDPLGAAHPNRPTVDELARRAANYSGVKHWIVTRNGEWIVTPNPLPDDERHYAVDPDPELSAGDILIDEADPPRQMIRTSVNGSSLSPAEHMLATQRQRVKPWGDPDYDEPPPQTRTSDEATDIITSGRRHGLKPGEALVVTSATGVKRNRRRVTDRDGSTLTVRDWHWWDWLIPAWLYRAIAHLPKFPGTTKS